MSDAPLTCRVPNCGRLWAVDINHGKVCSFHDEHFTRAEKGKPRISRPPIPKTEPVKPFCDPEKDDE
jgi:hypothetical protein